MLLRLVHFVSWLSVSIISCASACSAIKISLYKHVGFFPLAVFYFVIISSLRPHVLQADVYTRANKCNALIIKLACNVLLKFPPAQFNIAFNLNITIPRLQVIIVKSNNFIVLSTRLTESHSSSGGGDSGSGGSKSVHAYVWHVTARP